MPGQVDSFFDPATSTWSHVFYDPATKRAAVIDPVLDYDPHSGRTATLQADAIVEFVRAAGLGVDWILETHAHADHLTAAQHIKDRLGGVIAIGAGIRSVQETFREVFNLGADFPVDGRQFDRLLDDGDVLPVGDLQLLAMVTPGHTGDSMSLKSGNAVFIGDTLFSPAQGTARCDFPGGDAHALYASIRRLLALPPDTRLYLCHDYPDDGIDPLASVTVADQRRGNIHVRDGISEDEFVAMRTARDAGLELPGLMLPAVQVNIRAGHLPEAEDNGVKYLKIPLNRI